MDAARSDWRRGIAWAFFGSAMAATFLVPWKMATRYGEPRMAVLCLLTAAAVLNSTASLVALRRGGAPPPGRSWRVTGWLAVAFAFLTLAGNLCSAQAVARISSALLAVTLRCEVILVALLGALFLRERVRRTFWIGTAVAGTGLWLLQRPARSELDFDPLGVLFGLGAAACFGAMVVLSRRYITRIQLLPFNSLRLWLSVGLWFAVEGRVPSANDLPVGLVACASLAGFFGPFLSRLGSLQSAHYVPAHMTALASLATPAMTLGLSFVLLGNLPTARELGGGSVMLVGVAIPLFAVFLDRRTRSTRHGPLPPRAPISVDRTPE